MYRLTLVLVLFCLVLPVTMASAEPEPLEQEELLKLKNYELSLQNMELRIEVLNREMGRLQHERRTYFEELSKKYGLDNKWKIDLEKGIWVSEEAAAKGKAD